MPERQGTATPVGSADQNETAQPPQPGAGERQVPLLTIAIPTYDRAAELKTLLSALRPQLAGRADVELLVSDNASTAATAEVVAEFEAAGLPLRYHRHPENIGSDANFVFCFEQARGHYFWLCGDDDVILPGALDRIVGHLAARDLDIVYVSSYGFSRDFAAERKEDPLRRRFQTFADARRFARVVNIMFTFISSIIVNKARLGEIGPRLGVEPPRRFIGTNLPQLSWSLPLLREHRRSRVIWQRSVAGRQGDNGGYSLGQVFGERLAEVVARLLPDQPRIAAEITNFALRRWLPSMIYEIRSGGRDRFALGEAHQVLRRTFGRNPRYWLFTYPVLRLPLPAAELWSRAGAAASKLVYVLTIPGFWRRET